MTSLKPLFFGSVVCLALCSITHAKQSIPDWIQKAIEQAAPDQHEDENPSVEIIWDEATNVIDNAGVNNKTVRYALRILDGSKRHLARASAAYYSSSATRPKLKAWTIHSDGEIHKYRKADEYESNPSASGTLKTEVRVVGINGQDKTKIGDVFAYEYTLEESEVFTQHYWRFQSSVPVALSKFTITVPENWSVSEKYYGPEPERSRHGNTVTWEARNILSQEQETFTPPEDAKMQEMIVSVKRPAGSTGNFSNLNFESWKDIANYSLKMCDPMVDTNEELTKKTLELTKNATTPWEKIQTIGEYVKNINYEHIALDLGNGGGYKPRPASETFRVGWGDCKDKSTLLRSMLKTVGIDSYAVILNATRSRSIDESLPATSYFNHCIAAVAIDDSIDAPAVYEDESVGRLLFIDPTWDHCPIGEIPIEAQGGKSVVLKEVQSPLVKLPTATAEENKKQRALTVEILPNGDMIGRVESTRHGDSAAKERFLADKYSEKEYLERIIDRYTSGGNPSPTLKIVSSNDDLFGDRTYRNTIEFAYRGYAKQMQDVLLIFKPAILGRMIDNPFSDDVRYSPVQLRSKMLEESATIYSPAGYNLDELEPEILIQSDFGSYKATARYDEAAAEFEYTRTFVQNDVVIPVDRYSELQKFFASIVEAEQTPIVMIRAR